MLTGQDVLKHAQADDLWMIINGKVYDLTDFAPNHPGGMRILLKYAGKDATEEYTREVIGDCLQDIPHVSFIRSSGTIEDTLSPDKHLGPVDMTTVEKVVVQTAAAFDPTKQLISLGECLNLFDIERAAEAKLKAKAFAYYASAADDERTKVWNHQAFSAFLRVFKFGPLPTHLRVFLTCPLSIAEIRMRPRTLRNVTDIDPTTMMLGHPISLPIFIAPAAMGRLAHPEGERLLVKVAGIYKIPYMVSANASVSFEEIASLKVPGQLLIYQLYVHKDRQRTEETLRKVVAAGYSAICLTVDTPVAGKRERDERATLDAESAADAASSKQGVAPPASNQGSSTGIGQILTSTFDADLNWSDLAWIKRVTGGLPLIVKGIQSAEDAALCVHHGVEAIYLSNHGGRQLEGSPAGVETLLEIRAHEPHVLDKCEVYLDGGVKRGTDVLKALALGAKACGMGRPFLFSLAFGELGVEKVVTILRDEIILNMRLLGAIKIDEIVPSMVNARALEADVISKEEYASPLGQVVAPSGGGFVAGVKGLLQSVVSKARL
ncbi:BZ3500_MvSof-1268-A1-R1_Chr2-1g04239 [Microbotryum saponariae]|uniref:BZ3500_MvSof-1268-A1-R1_Chr2-1g04239 protein n=1 Tax=Microbotryum saponariae TaxID=289078 RepID=A0A2X0K7Q0_9BASI|nr:BZ3500_MvSof-1268-A1-R1_Chr2-1g04239 [Microbotryum saponariae]SCZ91226.1 BZ3501_MvSof-1269-A2-R1_Chr2-1g03895 [Microbotryum saponariae]